MLSEHLVVVAMTWIWKSVGLEGKSERKGEVRLRRRVLVPKESEPPALIKPQPASLSKPRGPVMTLIARYGT